MLISTVGMTLSNPLKKQTSYLCSSAVALAISFGAMAQEQSFVLEEIVVTAEKRGETSAMDTAFSVSATTGEQLESRGVISVLDEITVNPGVSVYKFSGIGNFIQLRGISGVVGDSTVGYYLDDLPYTILSINLLPDVNPYDLERLEVLRGPQGTLYGASSLGGTIRILTQAPEHNEFYGKVTGGYSITDGGDNGWTTKGAVNIPLIDDILSARVVASRVETGGYVDLPLTGEDDYNESTDENYRVKLRWTPTDDLDIALSGWHMEEDAGLGFTEDDYTWSPVFGVLDAFTQDPVDIIPVTGKELLNFFEGDLYNLRLSYDFGNFNFFSATSQLDVEQVLDINYFGTPSLVRFQSETLSHEMRLSFSGETVSWTTGLLYVDAENFQTQDVRIFFEQGSFDALNAFLESLMLPTLAGNPLEIPLNYPFSTSEQFAVFGEAAFNLTDELTLTVGLRYYDDEREQEEKSPALIEALTDLGLSTSFSQDFEKTTGRINLSWAPDNDSLYYLNIAQGFRPGAANPTENVIASFVDPLVNFDNFTDSEEIISYELGSKLTMMDGRLTIEAALYYMDWDDVINSVSVINSLGVPTSARVNAGTVEGKGIDLGVSFQATENLRLGFSGNINRTQYQDDIPGAGVSDGDQVALAPETTLIATAVYTWNISNNLNGSFRAAYQYTDERSDYLPGFMYTSESTATLNIRLGVESERWSVYLTGENLTDEDGEVSQVNALAQIGVPANRHRPPTLGLEATLAF